jgi:DNA polymerase V
MLIDLSDAAVQQGELALEDKDAGRDPSRLMQALDAVNGRYGRGALLVASAGLEGDHRTWSMKQERRTPGYTTRWAELAVARA